MFLASHFYLCLSLSGWVNDLFKGQSTPFFSSINFTKIVARFGCSKVIPKGQGKVHSLSLILTYSAGCVSSITLDTMLLWNLLGKPLTSLFSVEAKGLQWDSWDSILLFSHDKKKRTQTMQPAILRGKILCNQIHYKVSRLGMLEDKLTQNPYWISHCPQDF